MNSIKSKKRPKRQTPNAKRQNSKTLERQNSKKKNKIQRTKKNKNKRKSKKGRLERVDASKATKLNKELKSWRTGLPSGFVYIKQFTARKALLHHLDSFLRFLAFAASTRSSLSRS